MTAYPFDNRSHLRVVRSSAKSKKLLLAKPFFWRSLLVIVCGLAWIGILSINDENVFSQASEVIFSLRGIFLMFLALVMALLSTLLVNKETRFKDEVIFAFLIFLMAGLAEVWGMGMRPVFLPATTMVVYILAKIWIEFWLKAEKIK